MGNVGVDMTEAFDPCKDDTSEDSLVERFAPRDEYVGKGVAWNSMDVEGSVGVSKAYVGSVSSAVIFKRNCWDLVSSASSSKLTDQPQALTVELHIMALSRSCQCVEVDPVMRLQTSHAKVEVNDLNRLHYYQSQPCCQVSHRDSEYIMLEKSTHSHSSFTVL